MFHAARRAALADAPGDPAARCPAERTARRSSAEVRGTADAGIAARRATAVARRDL
ncbi:hypothetical protein SAZ11_16380 [Streptomyces sp. FXJ1.4098]|nr:hypothetical protein [Streptomyces sp. FXJ1.4098]